ncbi:MAG: hypothetical protein L3J22_00305 [Xanthomonadales bacterium]|nr:hypothetical protein [Xanthomonadales bacterium]
MSWFEYTENRKKFILICITVLCVAILLLTARRNVISLDAYWHLKTGLDWLNHGLSPWIDHFSFTYPGEEISASPYLFQGLIALLVSQFGLEPGFQIFRLVSSLSLFILFFAFLRQTKSSALVYLIALPVIVVLLQYRATVRPELISYSFSILAIMLYYDAGKQLKTINLMLMTGLILLWSNYHSPLLGYIIFFGYFVDVALEQLKNRAPSRDWFKWLLSGLVLLMVGFLTPQLQHPLMGLFTFSPEWKEMIQEYTPTYILHNNNPMMYVLALLGALTTALLVWQKRFGLLIVCSVFIYSAVTMIRMVTPAGIIMISILIWVLSEIDIRVFLRKIPALASHLIGITLLAVFSLALWSGIVTAREFMEENKKTSLRYPWDITNYISEHKIKGRIFNDYGMGGFLIHELSPVNPVYIDGRTNILYPIEHFKSYTNSLRDAKYLQSEVDKYEIRLIIIPNGHMYNTLVADLAEIHLDFVGASYSLYRRENPNFSLFGELLAYPACYRPELINQLQVEAELANNILPTYSPLLPFMASVLSYSKADNKAKYLLSQIEIEKWDDFHLRYNGFQALQQGEDLLVIDTFRHLNRFVLKDYLVTALANIRLGRWKIAEKSLYDASIVNWASINYADKIIMHTLLDHIGKNKIFEFMDKGFLKRLTEATNRSFSEVIAAPLPGYNSFCPREPTVSNYVAD